MKKPVNKFAVVLWVVAASLLVGEAWYATATWKNTQAVFQEYGGTYFAFVTLWNTIRSAILSTGELVALGVIVELIDQIRWNAKTKKPS